MREYFYMLFLNPADWKRRTKNLTKTPATFFVIGTSFSSDLFMFSTVVACYRGNESFVFIAPLQPIESGSPPAAMPMRPGESSCSIAFVRVATALG